MANRARIVDHSVPGEFFVDASCIDCDACRQLAPDVFGDGDGTSRVHAQPATDGARRRAQQALLACPVGAIGTLRPQSLASALQDFPLQLENDVYYCGFNSPKSYGGNSYFFRHRDGNWMIDAPRFTQHLVRRLEALGGVRHIFLTHRDDVADAALYAKHFGAERIIHRYERAAQPDAERIIDGEDPIAVGDDITILPTPGHTRGHAVLLLADRYLFAGDHLWWNRRQQRLSASSSVCWYSWSAQAASMERLALRTFYWVLPGHGEYHCLQDVDVTEQLTQLVRRMRSRHAA